MLICLSSGYRKRYLEDVVRAMAMPAGSSLQFRYEENLISEETRDALLTNQTICIAYLDCNSAPTADPQIIPCRFATLKNPRRLGNIHILPLVLGDFAEVADLKLLNTELRQAASNLPVRTGSGVSGSFVVNTSVPLTHLKRVKNAAREEELGAWQKQVQELKQREDFKDTLFYYFYDIIRCHDGQRIPPVEEVYALDSEEEYAGKIFHYGYEPTAGSKYTGLLISTVGDSLSLISNPRIQIDCPYDLKEVRFRTCATKKQTNAIISLYRVADEDGSLEAKSGNLEFDLCFRIDQNWLVDGVFAMVIGGLLATPSLVPIYNNSQIVDKPLVMALAISFGCLAGLIARFSPFRKLL